MKTSMIITTLAGIILCMAFTACDQFQKPNLSGTYSAMPASPLSVDGSLLTSTDESVDDNGAMEMDLKVTLHFNSDGTVVKTDEISGRRYPPTRGTYTVKGNVITVTTPEKVMMLTREGDVLVSGTSRFVRDAGH